MTLLSETNYAWCQSCTLSNRLCCCGSLEGRSFILLSSPICPRGFCSSVAESVPPLCLLISLGASPGCAPECGGVGETGKSERVPVQKSPHTLVARRDLCASVWEHARLYTCRHRCMRRLHAVCAAHTGGSRLTDHATHSFLSALSANHNTPLPDFLNYLFNPELILHWKSGGHYRTVMLSWSFLQNKILESETTVNNFHLIHFPPKEIVQCAICWEWDLGEMRTRFLERDADLHLPQLFTILCAPQTFIVLGWIFWHSCLLACSQIRKYWKPADGNWLDRIHIPLCRPIRAETIRFTCSLKTINWIVSSLLLFFFALFVFFRTLCGLRLRTGGEVPKRGECKVIFRTGHANTAALSFPINSNGSQRTGPRPKAYASIFIETSCSN